MDPPSKPTTSGITIGTNNRMSTDGTFNYTYDNEGNLTVRTRISTASANDKTITYTWDHRNRLTSIVYKNNAGTKTKEAIYEYDVFDRRTKKSVDLDGAGSGAAVVSRYVYDGEDILATTNSSGTVTSRLLHGPAVDQILAIETASNGAVHWALTDQLGSIRDIVDNSGTVANHIAYDSFGNVASETASSVDYLFGFTGRERDEESDLNYHRARYYSSSIGRWLSEDPIGFSAGDTNLRRYVNNNPVNFTDPSGNVPVSIESTYDDFMWHGSVTEHYWIDDFYLGLAQGVLNGVNGIQDVLVGIVNTPAMISNFTADSVDWFSGYDGEKVRISYFESPDWSRDLVVDEGNDGSHEWSKFLTGNGTAIVAGVGWSKISTLPTRRYLTPGIGSSVPGQNFTHAWIKRDLFVELRGKVGVEDTKQFTNALKKGIVGKVNQSGIKIPARPVGYHTHELKLMESAQRLLGYINDDGVLIFNKLIRGGLH